MFRRILILLGLLIFIIGLGLLVSLWRADVQASGQDRSVTSSQPIELNCDRLFSTAFLEKRVMTERETQSVTAVLANDNGSEDCETVVSLLAPGFGVAPAGERLVRVPAGGQSVTLVWLISPPASGSYQLALVAGNEQRVLGLTVTNILGLTALQAQLLSLLGTILGPLLSVPWWVERWEKRKVAQARAAAGKGEKE